MNHMQHQKNVNFADGKVLIHGCRAKFQIEKKIKAWRMGTWPYVFYLNDAQL